MKSKGWELRQSLLQLGLNRSPMHSARLPVKHKSRDLDPEVLQYPHCLPPIPLPILITLGKSGLISSQLSSLLTTHTMGSPGLSHSSNFDGHMASFIPFLDPISGPFLCPKPLSCALQNSQAAISKVPCIFSLLSECSLHSPSVVPWLFAEETMSPPH